MIDNFKSICEAVCYWLGYQFSIGRERLIHEASLRYPIADAITSCNISIDKIQLERGHPYFKDKRVDVFVCNQKVTSIDVEFIDSIFELKLSKSETGNEFSLEHQRVIDDILRLAYFNLISKKDSYFLICGTYENFKNYFVGDKTVQTTDENQNIQISMLQGKNDEENAVANVKDKWNAEKSLFKDYFNFDYIDSKSSGKLPQQKEYVFEIKDKMTATDEFGLKNFHKKYTSKKDKSNQDFIVFDNKLKIRTTCVAITPFESITNRTHACGIWKIEGFKEN